MTNNAATPAKNDRTADLKEFFKAFSDKNAVPLEPSDKFYVPIFENKPEKDPILSLKRRIEFEDSESVNLLTGFRGNGKSTQLRRLKVLLEQAGCKVFLINMLDVMLMTKPMELSDLLLSMMAAFSEALKHEAGLDVVRRGYWERTKAVLTSNVVSDGITFNAGTEELSAEMGLRLQRDMAFKEKIQEHLRGHLTTLVNSARKFVSEVVVTLRKQSHNSDLKIVLLVDSLEQIRGYYGNSVEVQQSVSETLSGQAHNLVFPLLHVVYTIPPYLSTLAPNLSKSFGGNPITCWPNIHVRTKDGQPDASGISIMRLIIDKRFGGWTHYFDEEHIKRLAKSSGGDLRDFFRLIREGVIALSNNDAGKVTEEIIQRLERQLLNESLPIANDDARWLARIHQEKNASIESINEVPRLARFQDSNLIMNYQNGEPWCDIHPLIIEEVTKLASSHPQNDNK
jgi:energy-coupling factor transporter ATP-binding protein EcfA2